MSRVAFSNQEEVFQIPPADDYSSDDIELGAEESGYVRPLNSS